MARLKTLVTELKRIVEAGINGNDSLLSADPPRAAPCPPGFSFNGKRCVSDSTTSGKPKVDTKSPMPAQKSDPKRSEAEGDLPFTRYAPPDDTIPLVPDPDSEVMQKLHNKVTYTTGLKPHEYADKEWTEYAHSGVTQIKFPDAFQGKTEWTTEFLNGEPDEISDWATVTNGDAKTQEKKDKEGLIEKLWNHLGSQYAANADGDEEQARSDFSDYVDDLIGQTKKEDTKTSPPVIVGVNTDPRTGKEVYYLLSGNTRALIFAYLGKPCPVRIVPLKGRMLPDPTEDELNTELYPAGHTPGSDDDIEQAIRAAVQRVLAKRLGNTEPPDQAPAGQPLAPAAEAVASLRKVFCA